MDTQSPRALRSDRSGRRSRRKLTLVALAAALSASGASSLAAQTPVQVSFGADRDNTMYGTPFFEFSNGAGQYVFAGNNGAGQSRRALLHFDIASAIPAGSTVQSVDLRMHLSQSANNTGQATSLHRSLADWGEGASDADGEEGPGTNSEVGDASWNYAFYPTIAWTTPGGDFVATASATESLVNDGYYIWNSTSALVTDVQAWVDAPATNFGWFLIGNESGQKTAKRLDSRENPNANFRPLLFVTYLPPVPCSNVVAAVEMTRVGTPANADALRPGQTSGPVLGSIWDPWVDHSSFFPGALVDVMILGAAPTNTPSGLGTILTFPLLATFTTTPGQPFLVPLPKDCSLAGFNLSWQAASTDGLTIQATNALDVTLGTF